MKSFFPDDFLWGAAAAANQYEGAYAEGGKGLCIQDVMPGGSRRPPTDAPPDNLLAATSTTAGRRIALMAEAVSRRFDEHSLSRIFPRRRDRTQ